MSKGFKEPKTIHIQPVYQPTPMPILKHIHYVPPAGAVAPLVHVSSYSSFAPTTPVSYASMPGAPAIPHFAAPVSYPNGGSGGAQVQQISGSSIRICSSRSITAS